MALSDHHPKRIIRVGAEIDEEAREGIIKCLKRNIDVFAWSHNDMPGIHPEVITHKLRVDRCVRPIKQRRRPSDAKRYAAIKEEVDRLLENGSIRKVDYPQWVSNLVMVQKSSGKWRMCVDYTNLNKTYPKDSFPLPRIDQLVDSTAGQKLLSFMDAYTGYNQILLQEEDQEHTSFVTDKGLYYYRRMPFGLKNAGATYQRLVNRMFASLLGNVMEVYVDDMLVKITLTTNHAKNLEKAFKILKEYGMKLNLDKCAFGVQSGKFLGFMVSERWIEANLEKIQALLNMKLPKTRKEIQSLTERVTALNRFISRSIDRCLPFFKALKKMGKNIDWTAELSPAAISSVLICEEEKREEAIYYISKGFTEAESRYLEIEKLALALVTSARELRPYFQAHSIKVMTNQPLKQVLWKPETAGRLVKWAVELGEFDIHYSPRMAVKGQAIADFISEFTHPFFPSNEGNAESTVRPTRSMSQPPKEELGTSIIGDSQLVVNQVSEEYQAKDPVMAAYLRKVKSLLSYFTAYDIVRISREQNERPDALARLASAIGHMGRNTPIEYLGKPSIKEGRETLQIDDAPSWMDPIFDFLSKRELPNDPFEARKVKFRAGHYLIVNSTLYK
ncbi:hypothetical protein ACLB2K_007673 [Fragaria x ananassa]